MNFDFQETCSCSLSLDDDGVFSSFAIRIRVIENPESSLFRLQINRFLFEIDAKLKKTLFEGEDWSGGKAAADSLPSLHA